MKACNYFQILLEGRRAAIVSQVGKVALLLQILLDFFSSYFVLFAFWIFAKITYLDRAGRKMAQAYKSIFAYNGYEIVAFRAKKTTNKQKMTPF